MTTELSLVPPRRLGELLVERRTSLGLTIEDLASAESTFGSADLRAIERGERALDDAQVHRLLQLYKADAGPVIPERSQLVIDLDEGSLSVADRALVLPIGTDLTTEFDDVLGRYLSLLYLLRGLEPGEHVSLRDDDLAVLAVALGRPVGEVRARLKALMLAGRAEPWFQRLRHRLAVPAAGVLVGLTAVGGLVIVQAPRPSRPTVEPAPAASAVDLIEPLTITRGQTDTIAVTDGPTAVGRAAESLIDYPIGAILTGWQVEFEGPRDGYRGNTNTVNRTITVYVSEDDSPQAVSEVLAHEVGHALDVMYLDDTDRARWSAARGINGEWWPESGGADFDVGAGDFAEAVAALLTGSPSNSTHGEFSTVDLAMVRELIPD